jgi:energy-coupling factor transport system substrate-specific component
MNLWSWPFIAGPTEQYWTPGTGYAETLNRYLSYYAVTSFGWDILRAFGNALLILSFGTPTLLALRRFQRRFEFEYHHTNPKQIRTDLET